ncbi:hypothetical protein VaNZ11_006864 [Volvox africanus]|uniref:BTB domain-containing protein n=1 Tax=Volvox africanus TaxID=51714 RepID=A0ABQ5S1P1_9CHLO|nr:hypothetical protein VaNZ11_006864 [Volvox africanus]
MDRPPATFHLGGRLSVGTFNGRAGAPASFDPSIVGHGPPSATTKMTHVKEYGSLFSDGFLKHLKNGDLADVVVEVVTEGIATYPTTTPAPPQPITLDIRQTSSTTTTNNNNNNDLVSFASPPPLSSATCSPRRNHSSLSPFASTSNSSHTNTISLGEYRLHSLLLARASAFFSVALTQANFADSAARRIRLTLDPAAAPAWPTLVDYFYTDRVRLDGFNALPLLALARQLMVSELDAYCMDYVSGTLCAGNCLTHLRASVRFAFHDLHAECAALAAQSFPVLHSSDLSGLPPASLLEILTHPALQVHCELQVVEAITRYLTTTAVDAEAQRALCSQIRFPYLDNATITRLAVQPSVVLAAAAGGRQLSSDGAIEANDSPSVAAAVSAGGGGADAPFTRIRVSDGNVPTGIPGGPAEGGGDAPVTHGTPPPPPTVPAAIGDGAAGSSSTQGTDRAALDGITAAAAAVAGGSSDTFKAGLSDTSAAVAAAAAMTGECEGGLFSASSSSCSSSFSSSGGAADPSSSYVSPPGGPAHLRHDRHDQGGDTDNGAEAGEVRGDHDGLSYGAVQQHHPLMPREMALEGALARLAAMEFFNYLPAPQAQTGATALEHLQHSYHQSLTAAAAAAAAGSGGGSASQHLSNLAYLHPYQQQLQNGNGGGRRQLAVFRSHGALQPAPPAAPPYGGDGGGVGPLARGLVNNLYYNHPAAAATAAAAAASGPHHHHPQLQPQRLVHRGQRASQVPSYSARGGHVYGGGAASTYNESDQQGGIAGMDPAAAFAALCLPPPRSSYCCNVVHGLPGGCAWVDVVLEALWEHLVPYIKIQVSGCGEGNPRHVISYDPDCFFETHDSVEPLPWIEVQLPHNVHMLQLQRYTFLHGHRRCGYYRARNFKTQIAVRPASEVRDPVALAVVTEGGASTGGGGGGGGAAAAMAAAPRVQGERAQGLQTASSGGSPAASAAASLSAACRYVDLTTRMAEQFDVNVLAGANTLGPWRVLRIQATGAQEDGVHRLCMRGLRMYGIARVDLMQQAGGFVVQPHWILNARVDPGGGGGGTSVVGSSSGASAAVYGYGGGPAAGSAGSAASNLSGSGNGQQWAGWNHAA